MFYRKIQIYPSINHLQKYSRLFVTKACIDFYTFSFHSCIYYNKSSKIFNIFFAFCFFFSCFSRFQNLMDGYLTNMGRSVNVLQLVKVDPYNRSDTQKPNRSPVILVKPYYRYVNYDS